MKKHTGNATTGASGLNGGKKHGSKGKGMGSSTANTGQFGKGAKTPK